MDDMRTGRAELAQIPAVCIRPAAARTNLRNYIEVELDGFAHNVAMVRRIIGPERKLMLVMKGDAYGHGLAVCGPLCEPLADMFAVATLEEALCLRARQVKKPILVLGPLEYDVLDIAFEQDLTICVHSEEYARAVSGHFASGGRVVGCQVKLDTGLNRLGIRCHPGDEAECAEAVARICEMEGLDVQGLYTHFSCADSTQPDDVAFTRRQLALYLAVHGAAEQMTGRQWPRHCASSAALLVHPEVRLDMVRVGMALFGQAQSVQRAQEHGFRCLLRWRARVVQVCRVAAGEAVSYGRRFIAPQDMTIAVLAAGYADGYKRNYSGKARVILGSGFAPVLGSVCMDFTVVDISGLGTVYPGDYATLLGRDGELEIYPNELCDLNDTVCGEVTCAIGHRVPRFYLQDGNPLEPEDFLCD